jgi:hypothetical protein
VVKWKDLRTLSKNAKLEGKLPVFTLTFVGRDRYYMVDEAFFLELIGGSNDGSRDDTG